MKGIGHGSARLVEDDTAAYERAMTVGQEALSRAVTWLEEMSAAEWEGEAAEQDGVNESQRGLDEASRNGENVVRLGYPKEKRGGGGGGRGRGGGGGGGRERIWKAR